MMRRCALIGLMICAFGGVIARGQSARNENASEALQLAEIELNQLKQRYGDEHPQVVTARDNVERLRVLAATERKMLRIYRLKYVQAEEAAALVREVFLDRPDIRVAVDRRLNSLVVQGVAESHDALANLIEAIDRSSDGGSEVRTFRLHDQNAGKVFLDRLKELQLADAFDVKSTKAQTEVTVTAVPAAKMSQVEDLLASVQRQYDPQTRRVRVVWLVSGLEDAKPISPDLKPVIEELEKFGVQGMSVAAETSVLTLNRFDLTCLAELSAGMAPVRLAVEGEFQGDALQISLEAVQEKMDLASLTTSIVAPQGHPVVLGVSPVSSKQSAFVVTVY